MRNTLLFLLLLLVACAQEEKPTPTTSDFNQFEDGFEVEGADFSALFPPDGSRWSNLQIVNSSQGNNLIELTDSSAVEGTQALRIVAFASDSILSKAAIEKGGFRAAIGARVRIEADFFIAATDNLENLLLIDLECCSCWDPNVPENQCPGVRLMMKNNDYLAIERGKILGSTFDQQAVAFPRNEWVNIRWQMQLSPDVNGLNQLWINGQEVLSEVGMNMPNADLFKAEAAQFDLDFQLQKPLFYERFQIGVTANPTGNTVEVLLDNVKIAIE